MRIFRRLLRVSIMVLIGPLLLLIGIFAGLITGVVLGVIEAWQMALELWDAARA